MKNALRLSLRELQHEWLSAGCFVFALVGVLAPLLILLALKNGVIGTMVERLVEDPANREIIPIGVTQFDAGFFEQMRVRDDVVFVVPATRRINAQATGVRNPGNRKLERAVTLIPSAANDPIIAGESVSEGRVWITTATSKTLEAQAGSALEILIGRDIDGERQVGRQSVEVIGVLPEARNGRQGIYLSLEDLLKAERFRDRSDIEVSEFDVPLEMPARFASFRMYASDLAQISGLLSALEVANVQARPRAENVALLLGFRDNLNLLYVFVAVTAGIGFWAAMAANLRGMVERQRVVFSLLRLLGMRGGDCARMPMIQSFCLVGAGVLVTLAVVWGGLVAINHLVQTPGGDPVAVLGPADISVTLGLGALTALTAAFWAVRAVYSVEMNEVLRHG